MILLDTSVLSLAFRRRRRGDTELPVVAALRRMVVEDAPMGVPGIVLQELLSGVRSEAEFTRLKAHMGAFPLVLAEHADHTLAARIANACIRKGVPTATVDCLIAALAVRRRASLLTTDEDFARMAPHCGLVLFRMRGVPSV